MEAKDLRIGNWVKVGDTESVVNEITKELIHVEGNWLRNRLDQIQPIPLTADQLLRLGAEKINNSMFRIGALTFQPTTYTDGETLTERLLNTRKAMRICFCGKFLVNIEFVHQYQNLYHALTGKDLTRN